MHRERNSDSSVVKSKLRAEAFRELERTGTRQTSEARQTITAELFKRQQGSMKEAETNTKDGGRS